MGLILFCHVRTLREAKFSVMEVNANNEMTVPTEGEASQPVDEGEAIEAKPKINCKRKFPFMRKRASKFSRGLPLALKPPLVVLHEKIGKVEYDVTQKGTGFDAGFTASFAYNDQTFLGFGTSKTTARSEAAKMCLKANGIPFNENTERDSSLYAGGQQVFQPVLRKPVFSYDVPESYLDFTKDVGSTEGNFEQEPPHPLEENLQRLYEMEIPFNKEKAASAPGMVLNELFPNVSQEIEWIETDSSLRFCCKLTIKGQTFHGVGLGKRTAKKNLAKNILSTFFGVLYFKSDKSKLKKGGRMSTVGKMHPYARVKHIDPEVKFTFEEVKGANDEELWKAKLSMCGKEYEASHKEREKAKLQVAKLGYQDNVSGEKDAAMPVEKVIDTKKNPLQMFYEYYGRPEFIEQEMNNLKVPYFLEAVEIDGTYFAAQATSKKRAKLKLALKVFETNNNIDVEVWSSLKDDIRAEYLAEKDFSDPKMPLADLKDWPQDEVCKEQIQTPKKTPDSKKNPVSILHELHQGLEFMFTEEYFGSNQVQFTCFATVGGKTFDGCGQSKKIAKLAAASRALEILYGIKESQVKDENMKESQNHTDVSSDFADKVADAVSAKFTSVFKTEVPYKVLAAVVMTRESNGVMLDACEVLSIGTGTKCIGGESISNSGQVLNDCHAEIITGRGLRQFFYDQIQLAMTGGESCFERVPGSQLFELKSSLHLFLYINTAPCGDGRVYNLATVSSNNKTIGMLRTKIENGQGTVPVPSNTMQTTDGILAGERLLTMSCSDKLMKWNVVGIQGALLTHFMKPVYLKGIIIGDQYNYEHLTRSLVSRVAEIKTLPVPFSVIKPSFGKTSKAEGRDTSKATSNSYNWYYGQTTVEVINGVTGKTPVGMPSRLSKMVFHDKFCQLTEFAKKPQPGASYHDFKIAAQPYQTSKSIFFKHLEEQGYGKWVGKPVEQDTFG